MVHYAQTNEAVAKQLYLYELDCYMGDKIPEAQNGGIRTQSF